jgi:Ca2+/Na+ antiporter
MEHSEVRSTGSSEDSPLLLDPEQRAAAIQILTTEHFTLQSARGAAASESSSRSALFLTVLSAALVALALAAQVAKPREVLLLALMALGVVFFLGMVTYLRVLSTAIEDYLYVREINRIRHFYVETVPGIERYFVLSHHDDDHSVHWSMGMHVGKRESLLTAAAAVGVVNSVVGGVLVALAVQLAAAPARAVTIWIGVGAHLVLAATLLVHGRRRMRTIGQMAPARFGAARSNPLGAS